MVGGVAAVLHGAPITTQDVDIVPHAEADNLERLRRLLEDLDARFRDPGGRDIEPDSKALAGDGQVRLITRCGPLDILNRLHDGRGYVELLPHSEELTDGTIRVRVLDLETLIEIKSSTGRARDQIVVPILLALARERDES